MAFDLTEEQRAAVENRGGPLLVSAAAGSGKTRVLVERLMDYVVREGRNIDEFLVITFTNAAAAELRGRVARELSARLASNPADRHLRRQTTLLYGAQICTIDAFCLNFLRQCGHAVGLDPDFRVCDEAESTELKQRAMDEVLEAHYENIDDDPEFRALADALLGDRDDHTLEAMVEDVHRRIQSHPDPRRWLEEQKEHYRFAPGEKPEDTAWGRLLLEETAQLTDLWARRLTDVSALLETDELLNRNYRPSFEATASALKNAGLAAGRGWEAARANFPIPFPKLGGKKGECDEALRDRAKALRELCKKQVKRLQDRFEPTADEVMEDLSAVAPAMTALLTVVGEFDEAFEKAKRRRKLLDFSDAEHLTVRLLTDGEGNATPLAEEWRGRFAEIMVDEYQDTNQVQNVLFSALSREGKNLFMVGDVKQSIYRFRLADPTIFLGKLDRYPPASRAAEGEGRTVTLSRNFRSRPEVLGSVNFLFRRIMSRSLGELEYDHNHVLNPGRADFAPDPRFDTELDAVNIADLTDGPEGKLSKDLVEARAAAKRIGELLRGGFLIADGDGERPIRPEDIVILMRSPGPVLPEYARALGEAGIPWSAEGGEAFFDTSEIGVALSYLKIVDNPRQDVPLLAVLRSPLCAFSPDRLAELRARSPDGDFYDALEAGRARGEEDCAQFLSDLADLRRQAGELSSHQFIWYLYDRTNLPGVFGAMENGPRRQQNLLALYDSARKFESAGHKGLFGFLTHIARIVESGRDLISAGGAGGGVRVMSIHKSKGLEFPVVFLCGLERQFNESDARTAILFHSELGLGPKRLDRSRMLQWSTIARDAVALRMRQEMLSEEMRLLYVAMTRAEQKLVLFTTVNGAADGLTALAREPDAGCSPAELSECRSVGAWVLRALFPRNDAAALQELTGTDREEWREELLARGMRARLEGTDGPGEPGTVADVIGPRWDICVLPGTDYESPLSPPAVRREEPGEEPERRSVTVPDYRWEYSHGASVDMPSKLTATQLKGREKDEEIAEAAPAAPARASAPARRPDFAAGEKGLTPAQKGTALHMALQYLDYGKTGTREEIRSEVERLVAGEYLTPLQGAAVSEGKILSFFSSNLGMELRMASRVEREFKFSMLVSAKDYYPAAEEGEEVLLQGVVDCWFENAAGEVTVLDFKTDRVTEDTVAAKAGDYTPQLTAYSRALESVLGKKVAKKALWFFALDRAVFVP